ncbi:hypothetical protein NG799_01770 [Laspinema sp. D1]|uniref:Uncharacterized protein n=2 Tax=Laspinema TaxID=2584823 RepID=A0ABT2MJX9_9CYAN|nr:hypothetical protein [Laspinema sp. D3b]MCT7965059.1 hypothetical protein [Laspinema sp. D2a]MCT7977654.1 hypothetical protein [Laspinema sp. D3b]
MAEAFEYLRERIKDSFWLGKEILTITEDINNVLNTPQEWFRNLPLVQFVESMGEPVFEPIKKVIEIAKEARDIITAAVLLTLESIYGVNLAFNSKTHEDLAQVGNTMLNNNSFGTTEYNLYIRAIDAHNVNLKLPELSQKLAEIEELVDSIPEMAEDAQNVMRQKEGDAYAFLHQTKNEMEALLETAEGAARTQARRILNQVIKLLEKFAEPIEEEPEKGAIILAPVAAVAVPTVVTITTLVTQIANFFLTGILLKSMATSVATALAQVSASVVLKYFSATGANGLRFLAADALRNNVHLLPKIWRYTAMQGFAWGFLMAYAPFIVLSSIIIIAAIRLSQDEQGFAEHFYVFADNDNAPAFAYSNILNPNQIRDELHKIKNDLVQINDNAVQYQTIMGLGIDFVEGANGKEPKVVESYDLSGPSPVKIPNSVAQEFYDQFSAKHNIGTPSGQWKPV